MLCNIDTEIECGCMLRWKNGRGNPSACGTFNCTNADWFFNKSNLKKGKHKFMLDFINFH